MSTSSLFRPFHSNGGLLSLFLIACSSIPNAEAREFCPNGKNCAFEMINSCGGGFYLDGRSACAIAEHCLLEQEPDEWRPIDHPISLHPNNIHLRCYMEHWHYSVGWSLKPSPKLDIEGNHKDTWVRVDARQTEQDGRPEMCDGNPVNLATGGKFQRETDIPAADARRLSLSRFYNGPDETVSAAGLGPGWTHTFSASVEIVPFATDGTENPSPLASTYYKRAQDACGSGISSITGEFDADWTTSIFGVVENNGNSCSIRSDDGNGGQVERLRGAIIAVPDIDPDEVPPVFVILHRPDGAAHGFIRDGENWISQQPDVRGRLVEEKAPDGARTGWVWRDTNGGIERYGPDGELVSITYPEGERLVLERDAEGRLLSVSDGHGRSLFFNHGGAGRIQSVTGPDSRVYSYQYDAAGNLVQIEFPNGSARQYHYESGTWPHGLTGITDENGERFATWAYDEQGRTILSEHAGGAERHTFAYADSSTTVTNPLGKRATYHHELISGHRRITDIDGKATALCPAASRSREYDARGHISRRTDWNGNATTFEHDEHGLETSRTEAAGTADARAITTEWDTDLRLPLTVEEPGLRTQYTYDARGRRLSMTETDLATGETRTTAWSYHPDSPNGVPGQLATIDGPRTDVNDVTTYQYGPQGNRTRVTNALGHTTEITDHDAHGRPLRLIDPNGLVTELAYDARGRLLSRNAGGEETTFTYDAAGNLTRIALPDGSELHYEHDPARRLIALADDEGHRIDYTLDAAGNRIEQNVRAGSGTLVRTQQQVFDELNRLVQTIGAQGQTTTHDHDPNGNRVATTDPAGDFVQNAFDALDRLTQVTDPMGGITTYEYDQRDRITAVTDPNGNTTRYTYNAFGDRTEVDSPDSGLTTYQYDAAGNVIEKTDARGQTTTYQYDAGNRLLHTQYADGATVDYVWDTGTNGVGRLSRIDEQIADGSTHATEWAYDLHGRVIERTQVVDGLTLTTQHSHDNAGRRIETVYPSGRIVTYSHDRDEVTGIKVDGETVLSDADYQPFGPVSGWTWGDGDLHSRSYDLDGRLRGHSLAAGSPNGGNRTIEYTADHNIAAINGPNLSRTYGYDGLDRLVAANDPDRTDQYVYDANGNRTERIEAGAIATYDIDAQSNRMLRISSDTATTDYSYDANSNLIDDGEYSYTYSARNRLIQVDDGNTAQYRYNALGQRIHKTAGSNVDYAALAAEYQQLADDLSAEATALSEQAQTTLDIANDKADQARQLNQEALALRQEADAHEQMVATLEDEVDQLRTEAQSLLEQAEQKEAEAAPLQEQADALFTEAAALREQVNAERQAARANQQQADALAESAQAHRAEADTLETRAEENDRTAAENRTRAPELEAEAQQLRIEADEKEAEAQPYFDQVERLQPRISALQRTIARFDERIERLRAQRIDNPRNWREYWHNWRLQWRIRIQQWFRDWQQYRLDGWQREQAEYQQKADALLAEANALREQADDNDRLAVQLREEADRLEAEANQLRRQAEEQRALAEQEETESADFAQQAEVHRTTAQNLDGQAQAKENEAQPPADQAQTLRTEAEALRADADAKTMQAERNEREVQELAQLAAEKRATADDQAQQADTLNDEAATHYTEADTLQTQADAKQPEAAATQQQADAYAALADNPTAASQAQHFVYSESGRLIGRYDDSGNAIREYFRIGNVPVAVAANDELYYIHGDQLGTPRLVSEPNGTVVWSWISDSFGDLAPNEDPDGDGTTLTLNLRFAGQYFDAESGLHQNWWRSYSPVNGRYISSDPIGLDAGLNTYEYAMSNPHANVDPDGQYPRFCSGVGCLPIDWPEFPEPSRYRTCQIRCGMAALNPIPDAFLEKLAEGKFGSAGKGVMNRINRYRVAVDFGTCMAECKNEHESECK